VSLHALFKNSVEKDCRKIPKDLLSGIFEHVEELAANPLPHDIPST